jgi:hypothetical protein
MRGVHLAPGTHLVEFKFLPSFGLLYVSLAANALGLLMLGILLASSENKNPPPAMTPHRQFAPASPKPQISLKQKPEAVRKFAGNGNGKKGR